MNKDQKIIVIHSNQIHKDNESKLKEGEEELWVSEVLLDNKFLFSLVKVKRGTWIKRRCASDTIDHIDNYYISIANEDLINQIIEDGCNTEDLEKFNNYINENAFNY